MWKTFQHDDTLYMIKLIQSEDNLDVYLTDLQVIWTQRFSKDTLLQQFKESNPLFDIKIEDIVEEVINIINLISDSKTIEITKQEDELELKIKSVKSEFKIELKFNFNKATSDVFLKEVTVPLIQTVKHLETCKDMLCNLVHKKDRELEEYKLEKGLISREDLVTETFDEATIEKIDDKSMMNVFGQSESFWESFVKKYGKLEIKIEGIRGDPRDPWNHIKRKRKVYSSKTAVKRGKGISYDKNE